MRYFIDYKRPTVVWRVYGSKFTAIVKRHGGWFYGDTREDRGWVSRTDDVQVPALYLLLRGVPE